MTDDHTTPETPDVDVDVSTAPEATDASVDSDETLKGVDKEMEAKVKVAHTVAEKMGVIEWAEKTMQKRLTSKGLAARQEMATPGTRLHKLYTLWDQLSPEGIEAIAKSGTTWETIKSLVMPSAVLGEHVKNYFKTHLLNAESLSIKDFDYSEIKDLMSIGALRCSEEAALEADKSTLKHLNVIKTVGYAAMLIPEAGPEITAAIKEATSLVEKPTKWLSKLMPEVRKEVRAVDIKEAEVETAVSKDVA